MDMHLIEVSVCQLGGLGEEVIEQEVDLSDGAIPEISPVKGDRG